MNNVKDRDGSGDDANISTSFGRFLAESRPGGD